VERPDSLNEVQISYVTPIMCSEMPQ